jgi:hypothetical protein
MCEMYNLLCTNFVFSVFLNYYKVSLSFMQGRIYSELVDTKTKFSSQLSEQTTPTLPLQHQILCNELGGSRDKTCDNPFDVSSVAEKTRQSFVIMISL